jgi:hypothetical protein
MTLLSPSRGERPGEGVRALRLPSARLRRPASRSISSTPSAFTPIPGPSPFEGEGRSLS